MTQRIEDKAFLPRDQPVRTGPTQVLSIEHYDTPFSGYNQTWDNETGIELYNDQQRCKDKNLCSLVEASKFSDDKEFHAYAFALQMEFSDPDLYEICVHYAKIELWKEDALKNRVWNHRMGAGGGVSGFDVNTAAFHLGNGFPSSQNIYKVPIPWIYPPQKTWKMVMKFMSLKDGSSVAATALQPTTIFNADIGGETPTRKLIRHLQWGIEYRDVTNG